MQADPDKTKAIRELERSANITELQQLLGIANKFEKFLRLAEITQPLRELLSAKCLAQSGRGQHHKNSQKHFDSDGDLGFYNHKAPA